jgi:two-component system OmpR family sensor kinase
VIGRAAIEGAVTACTEEVVVRRARARVVALVAAILAILFVLVGWVLYAALVRSQDNQIEREMAYEATADDPSTPPGCVWVFTLANGVVRANGSPTPPGFPVRSALDTVRTTGSTELTKVHQAGTVYYVRTQTRGVSTVQVVFDSRYQLADRRHLLAALALAGIVGLVATVLTMLLVGRFAVAPLVEALARQRRFVADASHELRTPIAQVHTRAQLLARRAGREGAEHGELDKLVGSTRRLGEIVEELLLSARLAAAPEDARGAGDVDLVVVVDDAVAAEKQRAAERGILVELVRPATPLVVTGIDSALRRVAGELLANALTHTPAGGRIEVTLRPASRERAELVVADTGAGFDPAEADRLFDRFHRGAEAGDRRFGLGLALLREVVTSHGGTIEAAGELGRGAVFTVRLPAREVARPRVHAPVQLRMTAWLSSHGR